ncbi:hypothetical protein Baya_14489 [Bagarius yarrelli]|uniref:Uncharacterized protein n=1 Tax=Bagarius yarrelli TaxID=175774 RepID=A0A556V953_BAGYA|nr:hypothetical protein Baya_14489 [Bagarius yarrelli]
MLIEMFFSDMLVATGGLARWPFLYCAQTERPERRTERSLPHAVLCSLGHGTTAIPAEIRVTHTVSSFMFRVCGGQDSFPPANRTLLTAENTQRPTSGEGDAHTRQKQQEWKAMLWGDGLMFQFEADRQYILKKLNEAKHICKSNICEVVKLLINGTRPPFSSFFNSSSSYPPITLPHVDSSTAPNLSIFQIFPLSPF